LKNKALDYEKTAKGRTYLIVNSNSLEEKTIEILAYFTLALKTLYISEEVSNTKRKKLDGLYKNTNDLPCYLIGQLGKNDLYKNDIDGHTIISYAINIIQKSHEFVGGRFILVECSNNHQLVNFYEENDFEVLQKDELVQLVYFL
jgi:hypothetical protein